MARMRIQATLVSSTIVAKRKGVSFPTPKCNPSEVSNKFDSMWDKLKTLVKSNNK